MDSQAETHRIQVGGAGFGEAGDKLIAKRAAELAEADGRQHASPADLLAARRELRQPVPDQPEDHSLVETERPGSGIPAVSTGHTIPRHQPEDEETISNQLVHEGVEEADHEARVASAEQHPPKRAHEL